MLENRSNFMLNTWLKMTNIIYRCKKCSKVVYRYKKGERPSDLVLGSEIGIHTLTCNPDYFDRMIMKFL